MREKFFGASRWMLTMAAVAVMLVTCGLNAKAAITQIKATNNSVTITWDDKTKGGYYLGYSYINDYNQAVEAAKSMALSKTKYLRYARKYTITRITPGAKLIVAIAYKNNSGRFVTTTAEVKTLPQPVSGICVEKWTRETHSCRVRWNGQQVADGYDYRFMDMNGNVINQGSTTDTSFLGKVANNRIYTASVKSYSIISGVRYDSAWSTPSYLMSQPARKKSAYVNFDLDAKVVGNKMKVKWEKVKGLDGYTVYATSKRNGAFRKVADLKANKGSCTIKRIDNKKLKRGKTYYIYVEAYKMAGGRKYTSAFNYVTAVKGRKHQPLWVGIDWK